MPDELEVETKELQETIEEIREERREEAREMSWTRGIALVTALLAVLAAVAALESGTLVNESLLRKNESVLKQAQASDQWNYYQAKGIKLNSAKQTADLLAGNPAQAKLAAKYAAEAKRYKTEQDKIKTDAEAFEKERDACNKESEVLLERHHVFAFCVTFVQVAIALCAIAALTKRKAVWYLGIVAGVAGLGWFIAGLAQH